MNEVNQAAEIGVSGIATDVTHVWKTVNLPVSFTNPVVVAGGATRNGGHQGVVRVRNVTSSSFEVRFQEWDYRDGRHTTEDIGYLVVEAGTYYLSDGTQIVASTVDLVNESTRTVTFDTAFGATPLVLGQVMTNNDAAAITERIRNITSSGLQIQLNEEEVADGAHSSETVGLVAIDRGTASADEISLNAVVTGNSVTHRNTKVNFGSIGGAVNPVILSDMQTRDGGDAATIRHRSVSSTSVTLFVEEEASRDTELNHTTEVVGVLALEPGVLLGSPSVGAADASTTPIRLDDTGSEGSYLYVEALPQFSLLPGSSPEDGAKWHYTRWVMQSNDQSVGYALSSGSTGSAGKGTAVESGERLHGRVAGFLDSMLDTEDSAEAEWNLDSLFSAMAVGGLLERL